MDIAVYAFVWVNKPLYARKEGWGRCLYLLEVLKE
jgi:hypothetical protein